MNLYTLTTRRKKLTFHPDGRVTESFVEEKHHGTPAGLVMTYQREFPGVFAGAVEEFVEEPQRRSYRGTAGFQDDLKAHRQRRADRPKHGETEDGFVTGDYAGAINAAMEELAGE